MAVRKITLLLLCALLLTGCKTWKNTVEVPVYIHDTTYVAQTLYDSVYVDKWHTIEVKGDSVYVTNTEYVFKWRIKTDTAYQYIEKPVVVTKTETKEVAKPLSWWQKTQLGGFWVLLAVLVGAIAWKLRKFI